MDESFSTAPDPDSSFILREHKPRRFQPRAFQLTPPVSPELSTTAGGPPPFVTTERGGGGRRGQHRANDSVASTWTANESTASTSTPTTATPDRAFPSSSALSRTRSPAFDDRPTSSLNHHASQNSFGQDARYGTPSRTSDYGDWDDGQSFASASEGFDSRPGSAASSRSEPEGEDGDMERTERARAPSAQSVCTEESSHQKGGEDDATYQHSAHHQRSASAATMADVYSPPVELFTRAMSPNGGRRRDGSVDLRGIGGGVGGGGRLAPERFAPWRAGGERPVSTATVKPVRRA